MSVSEMVNNRWFMGRRIERLKSLKRSHDIRGEHTTPSDVVESLLSQNDHEEAQVVSAIIG